MEITEELIEIFEACGDLDGEIDLEACSKCPYYDACLEYFTKRLDKLNLLWYNKTIK